MEFAGLLWADSRVLDRQPKLVPKADRCQLMADSLGVAKAVAVGWRQANKNAHYLCPTL
jgi:hypothetical protein